MIKLVIEPGVSKSWKEFLRKNPPFSIALDGYIKDQPKFSPKKKHLNLDHHSGVVNWATRCTSAQVEMWLTMGLFRLFQKNGEPEAIVYVNDADQDVCLSWWLLNNHEKIVGDLINNPRIEALLRIADRLDSTGDLYPMDHKSKLRKQVNWIFEPYTIARRSGRLKKMNAEELMTIIEAVCWRITLYVDGKGGELNSNVKYRRMCVGSGWVMIREIGNEGKYQACVDHDGAIVISYLGSNPERGGKELRHHYSVTRANDCAPGDLHDFYKLANSVEGIQKCRDRWGGNSYRGGSARKFGSRQSPQELKKNVADKIWPSAPKKPTKSRPR